MLIQEIALTHAEPGKAATAHLQIDGKEYMLLGSRLGVTVLCGRWCHDRRALGKSFYSPENLVSHYRKHGAELLRYANRITAWGN